MTTRMATVDDAAVIAGHRRMMFRDAGFETPDDMAAMEANFLEWVRPRLEDGRYLGWLVEDDGHVVAGAGVWLMDFPPHWMDAEPVRAYLLNFYTAPSHRGRGLAGQLLAAATAEVRRRGVKVATLHASKYGRPIYEKNGFGPTSEMMLRERK